MEAVKAFNVELQSLYDVKPPISKAKMNAITRGAIKAVKFYKHVVQSVEKFIIKCKIEYKVPGLYVIDSIVRQSRHQFGPEKDVFAPRFAKNIRTIFAHLFRCPQEDKSKVIRVLNLWLKNQVFPPDVIEPLFNFTDPNHPIFKEKLNTTNGILNSSINELSPSQKPIVTKSANDILRWQNESQEAIAKNPEVVRQLEQELLHESQRKASTTLSQLRNEEPAKEVLFDKKILDFDYGSDGDAEPDVDHNTDHFADRDDDDHRPKFDEPSKQPPPPKPAVSQLANDVQQLGNILSNPDIVRQLQTLQQTISMQQQQPQQRVYLDAHQQQKLYKFLFEQEEEIKKRRLQEINQKEAEFDKHLAQTISKLPFLSDCAMKPSVTTSHEQRHSEHEIKTEHDVIDISRHTPDHKNYDDQDRDLRESSYSRDVRRNTKHRSRSRSPYKRSSKRSRSRSDSRSRRRHRTKSRERDRYRERDRDRGKERERDRMRDREKDSDLRSEKDKEREKERENDRRHRGFPLIKKEHLSVCSTTIWVGHLSKLATQEDISDTFGEFGEVQGIHLVLPRGCAYVIMSRRQDAYRCMMKLKNHVLYGKSITLAWAPGKGVKCKAFNEYWDIELGVSYIPWSKIDRDFDIEQFEDGGSIDEDTMAEWMIEIMRNKQKQGNKISAEEKIKAELQAQGFTEIHGKITSAHPQHLYPPPTTSGLIHGPPPSLLPMVPPFPPRPPFGLMIPPPPFGVPPPNALLSMPMNRANIAPPPIVPVDNSTADDMDTSNDDDNCEKMEIQSNESSPMNNRRVFKDDNRGIRNDSSGQRRNSRWSDKRNERNFNQFQQHQPYQQQQHKDYRQSKPPYTVKNEIQDEENWDDENTSSKEIDKSPVKSIKSNPNDENWDNENMGDQVKELDLDTSAMITREEPATIPIESMALIKSNVDDENWDSKVKSEQLEQNQTTNEEFCKMGENQLEFNQDEFRQYDNLKPRSLLSPNAFNIYENQSEQQIDWTTNDFVPQHKFQFQPHFSAQPPRFHWNDSLGIAGAVVGAPMMQRRNDGFMLRPLMNNFRQQMHAPRGFNQRPNFNNRNRGQWIDKNQRNFGPNRQTSFRGGRNNRSTSRDRDRNRNNWREDRQIEEKYTNNELSGINELPDKKESITDSVNVKVEKEDWD